MTLKHVSDALFVVAVVLLVLGLTLATPLLFGAGGAVAASFGTVVVKRKRAKARRAVVLAV